MPKREFSTFSEISNDITSKPSISFDPSNKAYGADVSVNTGDHVQQKAYWDAGGANAKADEYSKAYGGKAYLNGDQSNYSGYDTSKVHADTTAYQTNFLLADMHQSVWAGGVYGPNPLVRDGNLSLYYLGYDHKQVRFDHSVGRETRHSGA